MATRKRSTRRYGAKASEKVERAMHAAGVYFYRLDAGRYAATRRLVRVE